MSENIKGYDTETLGLRLSLLVGSLRASGILDEGGCIHLNAVPVTSVVDGELLAKLCPNCDKQLPVHS
ncbi:hypothetical protein ACIBCT_21320 [Streptosporangium sp. NPDC050855]|uniref:hypothetical protein n=1 Tax=Streptosporangium sp. NPDC050855 TaxID=3366194 RepID=UPI0037BA874E